MTDKMLEAFERDHGNIADDLDMRRLWGRNERMMRWAWQAAQSVPAADEPRTLMTDDEAKAWAWKTLKADLEPRNWTAGESGNFYGFFNWGWVYRAQYEKQKPQQSVPVVGEVVAWKGGSLVPLLTRHERTANEWRIAGVPTLELIVQPTHSISAAELERLRRVEAALPKIKAMLLQEREWRLENSECGGCEVMESLDNLSAEFDAAIAAEGEK